MKFGFAVYAPESNKRRKLSLKRRKGPCKELFTAEGKAVTAESPVNNQAEKLSKYKEKEKESVTFDLGFEVLDISLSPEENQKCTSSTVFVFKGPVVNICLARA